MIESLTLYPVQTNKMKNLIQDREDKNNYINNTFYNYNTKSRHNSISYPDKHTATFNSQTAAPYNRNSRN